jgi:hypothetical protein
MLSEMLVAIFVVRKSSTLSEHGKLQVVDSLVDG